MTNPKEKRMMMEDRCSARSAVDRERKYMTIRPIMDPSNDPSKLPRADSIKSDKAISLLLAPNAIKMPTLCALRMMALTITSEIAKTNKTNVMGTIINLTIPLVRQTSMLNSVTAAAVMKIIFAICSLLLLRPFVINQAMVVR